MARPLCNVTGRAIFYSFGKPELCCVRAVELRGERGVRF